MKFLLLILQSMLLVLPAAVANNGAETGKRGGEIASLKNTPEMLTRANNSYASHRQDICGRYERFRKGEVKVQDALEGMQLHVVLGSYHGSYFNYNETTGIDPDYPGLVAILLDELADRAKFTWRDTFGIYTDPATMFNGSSMVSWTEMLQWTTDMYDVSADWWVHSLERMNLGIAFPEGWRNNNLILITAPQASTDDDEDNGVNLTNWLKPYDHNVWLMTVLTVLVPGLVYQVLEYFADERDDRTAWEWWLENFYLSAINATQAYEFGPKTLASRIFGISMCIWAMVMTATYTANLASLLVEKEEPKIGPQTIEEVVVFKKRICVWETAKPDTYIKETFPGAIRIQKHPLIEVYKGLHSTGECDFLIDSFASWHKVKQMKEYNPYCNLNWVGEPDRIIKEFNAGFATKADSGYKCSGFIRDVLNLHLQDMIEEGFLAEAWDREYKITQDIDCNTYQPGQNDGDDEDDSEGPLWRRTKELDGEERRRNLMAGKAAPNRNHQQRDLKASGKGAAAGAVAADGGGAGEKGLSPKEMFGTFVLHWAIMVISLVIAGVNSVYQKRLRKHVEQAPAMIKQLSSRMLSFRDELDLDESEKFVEQENKLQSSDAALTMATHDDNETTNNNENGSSTKCHHDNDKTQQELSDLRQQLTVLQLHLQRFEEKVVTDLGSVQQHLQAQQQSASAIKAKVIHRSMFQPTA